MPVPPPEDIPDEKRYDWREYTAHISAVSPMPEYHTGGRMKIGGKQYVSQSTDAVPAQGSESPSADSNLCSSHCTGNDRFCRAGRQAGRGIGDNAMIRLKVEPYCQNCAKFSPKADKTPLPRLGSNVIETDVVCEHADECRAMYDHIKGGSECT